MLLKVHHENPSKRHIDLIKDCLGQGGVIVYPTDSVYAIGCDPTHQKAVQRLYQITGKNKKEAKLTLMCNNISQVSEYTLPFDNGIFKSMKKVLPGPYTFILNANKQVPKLFDEKRKTIGIRIPNNRIVHSIIEAIGRPLATASLHDEDEIIGYTTDPDLIFDKLKNQVDIVIDGGIGDNRVSTIVDCTQDTLEVIREGKGDVNAL